MKLAHSSNWCAEDAREHSGKLVGSPFSKHFHSTFPNFNPWLVSPSSMATEHHQCCCSSNPDPTRNHPSLLVFSGGTAFNSVAEELNNYTTHVAHVLPVSDDGGSTAEIVRVHDIRSRCLRLSDHSTAESIAVRRLLGHRLPLDPQDAKSEWYPIVEGKSLSLDGCVKTLQGNYLSFSGLFPESGARIFFQYLDAAIFLFARVSEIPSESLILPVISTNERLTLGCELRDGTVIRGQNEISHPTSGFMEPITKVYDVTMRLYRTPYLVDIVTEDVGRVLRLDAVLAGNAWKDMGILIFNSWRWWTHKGSASQGWDCIIDGCKLVSDMDRLEAYYKGLNTWARWVDLNVNPSKTKIFFQGISSIHYQGEEWNQPSKSCSGELGPLSGSSYPAGLPPATTIVNTVLKRMKTPVFLLDITLFSQLRKDAHPAEYSRDHSGNDCSHWCLPGLSDSGNQLLYAALTM